MKTSWSIEKAAQRLDIYEIPFGSDPTSPTGLLKSTDLPAHGDTKGYSSKDLDGRNYYAVRPGLDEMTAMRVAMHEFAHIIAQHTDRFGAYQPFGHIHAHMEVVAEGATYKALLEMGMATPEVREQSAEYLASYMAQRGYPISEPELREIDIVASILILAGGVHDDELV